MVSRGLICTDNARALEWLKRIGYYRPSAYFIPFRVPGADNFQPGTTLTKSSTCTSSIAICACSSCGQWTESRLRLGLWRRTTCARYGRVRICRPRNFKTGYNHGELMRTIGIEEGRSAELFVVPYRHKYTSEPYLPIWMATEPISFGALSKMLRNVDNTPLQKKIAWEFGQPEVLFSSWTHVLSTVRNTCAHHSRLWNRELAVKPLFPKSWRVAGISNRRFYAVVLVIQT